MDRLHLRQTSVAVDEQAVLKLRQDGERGANARLLVSSRAAVPRKSIERDFQNRPLLVRFRPVVFKSYSNIN